MAMKSSYLTVHVQLSGQTTDDALHAAKVARQHGLQVIMTDGIDGAEPSLGINVEISSDSSQEIVDGVKSVQKFLIDVTDVH